MSQSQSVLGEDRVSYVEFDRNYSHRVTVHLNGDGLGADDLYPLADKALEVLADHVIESNPHLGRNGSTIILALRGSGRYGDEYLPDGRREALLAALSPAYVRKVTASAYVQRDKATGKHTGTQVTVSLSTGDPFVGVKAKQYDGKFGILRARVESDACSLVFSMSAPVVSDDADEDGADGPITKVVKVIADKLDALLVQPVNVRDDNPNAALNPANDHPSAAASTSESDAA